MSKENRDIKSGLALRVSLSSIGMMVFVYLFMQILAYFRDNAILGIADLSGLPSYVLVFIASYVVPPCFLFGFFLYLSARPFERALSRFRAGTPPDAAESERLRVSMLRFSWLVLSLNILGFALGYAILVVVEDGLAGFASPFRIIILVSNCSAAVVYASAQTALHNLMFGELRDRLGITEIGSRKRDRRSTLKQVSRVAAMTLYAVTFMQFNLHGLFGYQNLASRAVLLEVGGGVSAAESFRSGIVAAVPGVASRAGFSPEALPLPWIEGPSYESREVAVFMLTAFFLMIACILVQAARSLETKDQIFALNERLRDVIEGEGDLTRRISLRSTDEFGQLAESVNRLIERFRSLVSRIAIVSTESRNAADAIDRVLKQSESVTMSSCDSVIGLSSSIEEQVQASRSLEQSLDAFRAAVASVSEAIGSQRRFTDETATAMEEMAASIRSVEKLALRSGDVSADLSRKGEAGAGSVSETAGAIREIEKSARGVLKVLGSLSKIAGDTNLLAMNAAIEAAHAGSTGAGFAVVADEVRSLASMAAKETKTIKAMVAEMEQKVRKGVETSVSTSQAFETISGGIREASSISAEISSAMREQSAGTRSVENAISRVVDITRSVGDRMSSQEQETSRMQRDLGDMLERFSSLARSAREQAESMKLLETAFLSVRREVDRNLAVTGTLEKELSVYRV